jgi:hypothetical protein
VGSFDLDKITEDFVQTEATKFFFEFERGDCALDRAPGGSGSVRSLKLIELKTDQYQRVRRFC